MHRLLKRQLKRHLAALDLTLDSLPQGWLPQNWPDGWEAFLNAVNSTYEQADTDRFRLEHIVGQSSQELIALNSQMRAAIPDTFLRLNKQGIVLDYKPGRGQMPYLSSAAVVGMPLSQFLPAHASQEFLAAIAHLDRDDLDEVGILHKLTDAAGNDCFYEVRILPLLEEQVVAIVRDITERKQAEAALHASQLKLREKTHRLSSTLADLKDMQAQLVQSEKMSGLGQLVAGIAHEINNPVNFVSGNIGYVQSYIKEVVDLLELYASYYPDPAPEIQERVEDIDLRFLLEDLEKTQSSMKLGVNRIKEIVRSLRIFSRLDEAEMKEVNIHEGIESTLLILNHRFKPAEGLSKVELVKVYGELPPVECYAGQLNQVFMNVLANALDALEEMRTISGETRATANASVKAASVKAMSLKPDANDTATAQRAAECGSLAKLAPARCKIKASKKVPKIEIVTEQLSNHYVSVRIINNGPNIPYEIRDRLFDPFFTTKPIGSGTGLGLSISYQIVTDRHGGRMRCYSLPGQRTEFCIEIPVRQA